MASSSSARELFVMAAYLSGAVCIVLCTLALGWIIVWKCVLSKMPFVQELFDLKPATAAAAVSATTAAASSSANGDDDSAIPSGESKTISFQERVEATKRKRLSTKFK